MWALGWWFLLPHAESPQPPCCLTSGSCGSSRLEDTDHHHLSIQHLAQSSPNPSSGTQPEQKCMINSAGADKTRPVRRRQPTHRLQQSQKLSWPKQLNHKQASFLRRCPTGADPSQFTSSGLGRDFLNSNMVYFVMLECYPKACLLRWSSYLGFGHPSL